MMVFQNKSVLSQYEIKDRADPTKYLYDALDSYFSILVANAQSGLSLTDLLTMKVMSANDAENVSLALDFINEIEFNQIIKEATERCPAPKNNLEDLLNKNKISALKIQLILRGMKMEQPLKMKLKAGHIKEEKIVENENNINELGK